MKIITRIFFLAIALIFMVGCSTNGNSDVNRALKDKVTIKGYYEEPKSFRGKETIVLNGVSEGEFVEIIVEGKIVDFELVKLEWDEKKNDIKEKETLSRFDTLTNQVIVIKTYMPEGIPLEKVKWKSSSGKPYEYIIHERGIEVDSDLSETVFYIE